MTHSTMTYRTRLNGEIREGPLYGWHWRCFTCHTFDGAYRTWSEAEAASNKHRAARA